MSYIQGQPKSATVDRTGTPDANRQLQKGYANLTNRNIELQKQNAILQSRVNQLEISARDKQLSGSYQILSALIETNKKKKQNQTEYDQKRAANIKQQQQRTYSLKKLFEEQITTLQEQIKTMENTILELSAKNQALEKKNKQQQKIRIENCLFSQQKGTIQQLRTKIANLQREKTTKSNQEDYFLKIRLYQQTMAIRVKQLSDNLTQRQEKFKQLQEQAKNKGSYQMANIISELLSTMNEVSTLKANLDQEESRQIQNFIDQSNKVKYALQKQDNITISIDRVKQTFGAVCQCLNKQLQGYKKNKLEIPRKQKQHDDTKKQLIDSNNQAQRQSAARINELLDQIRNKDQIIRQITYHKQDFQARAKTLQGQKQNLTKQLKQLNFQFTQMKQLKQQLDKQCQSQATTIKQHEDQIKANKTKINDLTISKKQLEKTKKSLEEAKANLEKQLWQQQKINDQNTKKIEDQSFQLSQCAIKIKNQKENIKKLEYQVVSLKSRINNLQNDLQAAKSQLATVSRSLSNQKASHRETQDNLSKKKTAIAELTRELENAHGDIRQLKVYEHSVNLLNKQFFSEFSYYISNQQKKCLDVSDPETSLKQNLKWFKDRYNEVKFFGDSEVIPREKVSFLLKELKSFSTSAVTSTKLLFKFDQRAPLNFHHFIDGKEHLFIVIKLINGMIIGGYSQYPLQRMDKESIKRNGLGKGFLFNLSFQKIFHMRKDAKSTVLEYDEFFFIFGKTELRLKIQEKKFFSNFAVTQCVFDPQGMRRNEFLGTENEKENELEIIGYEFYQIMFKP